jgi:hypothetical protein
MANVVHTHSLTVDEIMPSVSLYHLFRVLEIATCRKVRYPVHACRRQMRNGGMGLKPFLKFSAKRILGREAVRANSLLLLQE